MIFPVSLFDHYVGIDYSGAQTAEASLKGIRAYSATASSEPEEVLPLPGQRKYWSRRTLASWLLEQLLGEAATIVGIDHAFSFPTAYYERHSLPNEWSSFLDDFQSHCPTDEPNTCVDFVRKGRCGCWSKVTGEPSWLRLTEKWTASAKSAFLFDVQGAVAKSTYAGLPWLRYLRQRLDCKVHFWPFDGWEVPQGRSVVAEVYPSLWMKRFAVQKRTSDQHAAYSVSAWLRRVDKDGSLFQFLHPALHQQERTTAETEGWILGVI